ncbi:MAG: hypothetical protein U0802_00930 [Candidatus Binatia bacterium]
MAARVVQASAAQTALLDASWKAVAEKVGLRVREERLLREVGYRVRSGRCRLQADEPFIDRTLPVSAQIDVLVDELAGRSLDDIYLSPAARASSNASRPRSRAMTDAKRTADERFARFKEHLRLQH